MKKLVRNVFFVVVLIGNLIACKKPAVSEIELGFYKSTFSGFFADSIGNHFNVTKTTETYVYKVTEDSIFTDISKMRKSGNHVEGDLFFYYEIAQDSLVIRIYSGTLTGNINNEVEDRTIAGNFTCKAKLIHNPGIEGLQYIEGPYTLAGTFVMTKMKHLYK